MRVAILEDYQRASQSLACFSKLAAHQVEVFSEPMRDEAAIASRIAGFDAVVLIRERTRVTKTLLEKLPNLKLVVQTAKIGPHLGFVERGGYEKYFGDAFDAVNAFASGKPIRVVP